MISYVKLLLSMYVTYVQDFLVVLTYKLQQQNMVVGNVNIYIVPPFPIGRSDMGGKIKKVWFTYSDTLFSSVFFNSKTALFSCIFWFQDSFLCKFTYLHLLSGLQGRICQNNITADKKYFGLTNVSFQCHTSLWNTPITMRKWFQNRKFLEVLFFAIWKLQFSAVIYFLTNPTLQSALYM